jgi:hypothetical protein
MFGATAGAIFATAVASPAVGGEIITIGPTYETTAGTDQRLTISGLCSNKKITVTVKMSPSGKPDVSISAFGMRSHVDPATPFVHDLFGGKAVLRYLIVCSGPGFELWAFGASFDDAQAARYVSVGVVFDKQGRVTQYSGLMTETYDWIRGNLR